MNAGRRCFDGKSVKLQCFAMTWPYRDIRVAFLLLLLLFRCCVKFKSGGEVQREKDRLLICRSHGRARAERGVAKTKTVRCLSATSHGYSTSLIYNTKWANLRPMVSFLLVSVNNHRKRRSWVQSLWVFPSEQARSYAKDGKKKIVSGIWESEYKKRRRRKIPGRQLARFLHQETMTHSKGLSCLL